LLSIKQTYCGGNQSSRYGCFFYSDAYACEFGFAQLRQLVVNIVWGMYDYI